MPNAELSSRFCDYCGSLGALLQCGSCKQVAYCNFSCQKIGWKEHKTVCRKVQPESKAPAPAAPVPTVPRWLEHHAKACLPRPRKAALGGFKAAQIEDFFDRDDLDCGVAALREKGRQERQEAKESDQGPQKSGKPALFGQAMGMAAPRRDAAPVVSKTAARVALEEAEKLLHQVAGEVLYQAGFMGHGSVWDLGPAAEKVARKCLQLLNSKVLPVLRDPASDILAKFLHGSANYFLRRAMSSKESEQRLCAQDARAKLLQVYTNKELSEDYRENACDFLAALFHEEKQPEKAEVVLRGADVDASPFSAHDTSHASATGAPFATGGATAERDVVPQRNPRSDQVPSATLRGSDTHMGSSSSRGPQSFRSSQPSSEAKSPWAWKRSREAAEKHEEHIPSIDEVLARLDLDDEEERQQREMRSEMR